MRYAHIYSRIVSTPWFLDEPTLAAICQLLQSRMNGLGSDSRIPRAGVAVDDDSGDDPSVPVPTEPGIAVIPVVGVLGRHLSMMETMCGGCDMDQVRQRFDAAMADNSVRSVVLYIDSPGGMAIGCHELFTHMFTSKVKPLYAYTDSTCGSAAYYLACAADAIFTAPTARVGSIGSMLMVRDDTKMNERLGVKFTLIRSGEWKGLGNPSQPLTKEGAAILQDMVDQLGAQFRADVASSRPSIAKADMEGLAYLGRDAVTRNFADGVVLDLQTLLKQLGG